MTRCSECDKRISRNAYQCPHCGGFPRRFEQLAAVVWLAIIFFAIPCALGLLMMFAPR